MNLNGNTNLQITFVYMYILISKNTPKLERNIVQSNLNNIELLGDIRFIGLSYL